MRSVTSVTRSTFQSNEDRYGKLAGCERSSLAGILTGHCATSVQQKQTQGSKSSEAHRLGHTPRRQMKRGLSSATRLWARSTPGASFPSSWICVLIGGGLAKGVSARHVDSMVNARNGLHGLAWGTAVSAMPDGGSSPLVRPKLNDARTRQVVDQIDLEAGHTSDLSSMVVCIRAAAPHGAAAIATAIETGQAIRSRPGESLTLIGSRTPLSWTASVCLTVY